MKDSLTVIEAVKSGRRFRPLDSISSEWYSIDSVIPARLLDCPWEIEERKIEITESEFNQAWDYAYKKYVDELGTSVVVKEELKKRLFEK